MVTKSTIKSRLVSRLTMIWLLLCLAAQPALAQDSQKKLTAEQVKTSILNSFIFRSTDIFYPNEVLGKDRKYSELSSKEVEAFNADLNRVAGVASEIYGRNFDKLQTYLGKPLPSSVPATIHLLKDETSIIRSQPSEDSSGREVLDIELSLNVLQISLRAGVAAAYRGPESLNPISESNSLFFSDEGETNRAALSDEQIVEKLLAFKKRVKSALSKKLNPLQLDVISTEVTILDSRYTGVLLFSISHELGHFALNHFHPPDYPECVIFKQEELDADRFASYLLGRVLTSRGVFGAEFVNSFNGFFNYIGAEVFFQEGYERYGLNDAVQSGNFCHYPPAAERLTNANNGIKDAIDDSKKVEANTAIEALDKRIQEIQNKNLKRKKS